ncbi:BPI fold-containing family C protein-like [Anomaloglossus baeobatrachus]|uniref:BPI fold-containing family C protein-like n=1 Tax=Anomaloglossus baeobatrachus TaxID=238106 RepID=UPI003F5036B2
MWVPNIIFLLLTLSTICYGSNPGAKILITEQGLQKGVEYLVNQMMSNNTDFKLPNMAGTENIASEDMNYEFTQIRIVKFQPGTISSQWVPETGMHVLMENGKTVINANWKLESWLINDSGSCVLSLSGLSINIMMGIRRIDPGVPSIYLLDCQSSIQDVDVQILGGVSYIFDSLKEPIQQVVKRSVTQQLCSSMRNEVKKWDQSFSQLNLNLTLNPLIKFDLSLVGNPEISDHYANMGLKGLFHSSNKSLSGTSFSPAPITIPVQNGAMVYIGVSQSSLESLSSAYYSAGFLTFQVSHMAGSKELTTAELANYIPEISQHFPDPTPVKIQLHSTRPPLVFLRPNNMTVQFGGSLQTHVYNTKNETKNVFSANIVATFQVSISLADAIGAQGLNFTGFLTFNGLQIEGSHPSVKGQKVDVSVNRVQQLFQDVVMPVVNENFAGGIFIPSNFLKNSSFSIHQGFAILAADMK